MSNPEDVLSLADAAAMLGRSVQSVRTYMRCEELPAHKVGGRWVVLRADLVEWSERAEVKDMMERGDRYLRQTKQTIKPKLLATA